MSDNEKKVVPIKEGFWTSETSVEDTRLIGSKCGSCGELFFPKKEKKRCINCYNNSLEDVLLSPEGKIVSFSVVMQQPGGGFYSGPVPYAFGQVDIDDGIRITTLYSTDDFNELETGKRVKLVIEKLSDDNEGNEIATFKFKPIN